MKKRVHAFFSGTVQGVGFRFTAERIASLARVTGWVKNLRDGKVEVVVEGEEDDLKQFLDRIGTGPLRSYIRDVDVSWEEFRDEFDGFGLRF